MVAQAERYSGPRRVSNRYESRSLQSLLKVESRLWEQIYNNGQNEFYGIAKPDRKANVAYLGVQARIARLQGRQTDAERLEGWKQHLRTYKPE